MKILKYIMIWLLFGLMVAPAWGVSTIDFSPGTGGWSYNGTAATMTFDQTIEIDAVLGDTTDILVTSASRVFLSAMTVTDLGGGAYDFDGGPMSITDSTGAITYMTGTIGSGDLVPVGTLAVGYTEFMADIDSITVTSEGQALGSAALDLIAGLPEPRRKLDLSLTMVGPVLPSFEDMLENDGNGSGDLSGSMTVIPAPGAILLASIGVALTGWIRRSRGF